MCGVTFSSHRKLTESPHLTRKGEQKIGLHVCGYKTWKWESATYAKGGLQGLSAVCWLVQVQPFQKLQAQG